MSIQSLIGALFLVTGLTNSVVAADSRPDVSQIINKAEASNILGEPVKDPSPRSGDGTDGYYSKCNYYSVNRGKSLIIRLQLPGPNAIGPQQELQLLAAANGAMEKISGVGDAAQMSTSGGESGFASRVLMLYVTKGNAFLTIGLGGFVDDAIALEKAKTVAQKLLEHL
ncbi:MAG TPA: hypothetical protein VNW72_03665 [Chthoniobacterales bacterium]|jgi:hypothetical protein|nr:hypothetical protein [Chthoniobacterales bacterium]